jgi:hypothetical protein
MKRRFPGIRATGLALAILTTTALGANSTLRRPHDLRELVFLSSGYGMAYGPAAAAAKQAGGPSPFTNVFVTPDSYRRFMQTGKWPDGTTFFLELRQGVGHAAADVNGAFQGTLIGLAAEQKDTTRYPDGGFAFFDFGSDGKKESAQPLPHSAPCYACHGQHGAVEWTFTQFYPEQFAVAQRLRTVRKDYDPNAKLN